MKQALGHLYSTARKSVAAEPLEVSDPVPICYAGEPQRSWRQFKVANSKKLLLKSESSIDYQPMHLKLKDTDDQGD